MMMTCLNLTVFHIITLDIDTFGKKQKHPVHHNQVITEMNVFIAEITR